MTVKITRIGNSRGVRLPREVLALYRLDEGDSLELEQRPEGILLTKVQPAAGQLSYADSYREMAAEVAESAEWDLWDSAAGDGLAD